MIMQAIKFSVFILLLSVQSQYSYANQALIHEPIRPLQPINVDAEKAALGERLFYEPRLSSDNSTSCAHCHQLENGGVDGLKIALGINHAQGKANTPTVFNAALNTAQFWDGRALTLTDQIEGSIHATVEMNSNWPDIIAKLSTDHSYLQSFNRLYKDGINAQTIKQAIVEFERTLITTNSRFDQYLNGDNHAISPAEKKGYDLFKGFGCVACHQGENVGGNLFQKLGVMRDYFTASAKKDPTHLGRFNITKKPSDQHKFKVPSLRLVTQTAPYFHDGSIPSLKEAIHTMGVYQLGIDISDRDIASIIIFLKTLAGDHVKMHEAL